MKNESYTAECTSAWRQREWSCIPGLDAMLIHMFWTKVNVQQTLRLSILEACCKDDK